VNLDVEHEAFGVYQQVPLSAFYLLATVLATFFATHAGRLNRLAVDYPSAGLRVSLQANS